MATDHRTNLHGDNSLASQTIFVRSGEKESILVSGSEQRVKKHKKMSVGDSKILDNTLELVEAEITDDLVENNSSTTAPSSGEKVYHDVTTEAGSGTQEPLLETIDTQRVSGSIKLASVKETLSTVQIPLVLEPVFMSGASRRGIPSHLGSPIPAPSSEAGSTTPYTDKGEPRISENFACVVDAMEGKMGNDDEDASQPRDTPLPGVPVADTSSSIEAGTGLRLTQAGVGGRWR